MLLTLGKFVGKSLLGAVVGAFAMLVLVYVKRYWDRGIVDSEEDRIFILKLAALVGAGAGALLGGFGSLLKKHEEVENDIASRAMDFEYLNEIPSELFNSVRTMPFFWNKSPRGKFNVISHVAHGTVSGLDIWVMTSPRDEGVDADSYAMTYALLPTGGIGLPHLRLTGHWGLRRYFWFSRTPVGRFNQCFDVQLEGREAKMSLFAKVIPQFVMEFFAEHPEWSIETHMGRLVVWNNRMTGPYAPEDRPDLVLGAIEVQSVLQRWAQQKHSAASSE
jgi:hypothetical protein